MLFFARMIYSSLQAKYHNSTIRLDQANRNIHVCDHNHLMSILNKDGYLTKSLASSSRHVREDVKLDQPIRVVFNFDYIDDTSKDNWACKKKDDKITWGGTQYICTSEDLITEQKIQYTKQTFKNVGIFLKDTLKVHPTGPFRLDQLVQFPSDYPQPEPKEVNNADLYLFVFARPYGGPDSSVLASAAPIYSDVNSNGRPFVGFVHVNFAALKTPSSEGESQTSKSRDFFETALHEITHALGFTNELYSNFYNKKTGKPYGQDLPLYACYNKSYQNQEFLILATPKLHEVTSKLFGQEKLDLINDETKETTCPIGAIIEDEGDEGTAFSHFKLLTHMNEVMVGMTIGHRASISMLTLAFLEDTGWYSVDYSKAEPYYYGNYQADYQRKKDDKPYTNFLTGPPQLVFPDHYIYHKDDSISRCSFDHRSFGFFPLVDLKCTGDNLCPYIDPLGTGKSNPNDLTNQVPILYPYGNKVCNTMELDENLKNSNDENAFCVPSAKSNTKSDSGLCYKMSCNENELTVYVGDQSGKCPKKDDEVTINSVTITCPDPNVICGILNYENYIPKPEPSGGGANPDSREGKDGSNPGKTAGIVIGVILGIAVIVGVIVFVMIWLRRKADNEKNETTA